MNKTYQLIREAGLELKYDLQSVKFVDYHEPHIFLQANHYSESSESHQITDSAYIKHFRDLYFMKLPESLITNRTELLNKHLNGLAIDAERGSELDRAMWSAFLDMGPYLARREAEKIASALPPLALTTAPKTQRGRL